jgi:hypothetical protein
VTVAKAVVQLVATVLAGLIPALSAGPLDTTGWINVVILAAGIVMVYNAANIPGWSYAKLVASAVSAVAVVLVSSLSGGISLAEIIQMVVAFLGALGVGAIPNGGRPAAA